ncbi:hypothetical protein DFH08DRAFT_1077797 [Mycena albidolilacea]|uniref:Uncharacterized protein n=1 Tax=Mycena albidolilacea TaxID=1033008 RepID=A0AAD7A975_9AGAR|nr:hypothetical protein DFH08DRAFT_1077797 [Mycena albidolilacea]
MIGHPTNAVTESRAEHPACAGAHTQSLSGAPTVRMDYDATHRDSVNDTKGRCHLDPAPHVRRLAVVLTLLYMHTPHLAAIPSQPRSTSMVDGDGIARSDNLDAHSHLLRLFFPVVKLLLLPPALHLCATERTASTAPPCYIARTEIPRALVERVAVMWNRSTKRQLRGYTEAGRNRLQPIDSPIIVKDQGILLRLCPPRSSHPSFSPLHQCFIPPDDPAMSFPHS